MNNQRDKFAGILWGTAVGDSIGLPAEGLSREKLKQLGWNDNWKQRLIFGKGMLSDDTEHTIMVVQTLFENPDDVDGFLRLVPCRIRKESLGLK
jgi:ADP-ribosyl-[dinitrogen reductase] hydrolase